ncbi:hypothetical protein HCU64_24845 [Methylobacterium sp. C25]|uniref:DUF6894 family protein n=1 Tax=Methylobacterium sp. C25 TaxID=2721622 RepID=UPI001F2E3333|nr:hypothetical protein [Methylobacterium sp. C25]MCE4226969.1 hypothetical protein [Methylobacterium sp. C25]
MPRFFFDVTDRELIVDNSGDELPDANAARIKAISKLSDINKDVVGDTGNRELVVVIRGDKGQAIYRASLSFKAGWVSEPT